MDDLTKDQQKILVLLYKQFLSKQPALDPEAANYFGDSDDVRNEFFPDMSSDYMSSLFWKLCDKGYVCCEPGDDLANDISLTDKTIIYMENRFKNDLKSIGTFLLDHLPF